MDAPLITLDPAANTTDVYAFVDRRTATKRALSSPWASTPPGAGIGPNKYNFDDNVLYEIHVATGRDLTAGRPTISYQFAFDTTYQNMNHSDFLHRRVDTGTRDGAEPHSEDTPSPRSIGTGRPSWAAGIVPPNNQGNATPFYNQGDNGDNPAKDGVSTELSSTLHPQTITQLEKGYIAFAGQRDDGFFADVWRSSTCCNCAAVWASPGQRIRKVVSTFT